MWFQVIVIVVCVVVMIGISITGYKFVQRLVASLNSAMKRMLEIEVAVNACSQTLDGIVSGLDDADDESQVESTDNAATLLSNTKKTVAHQPATVPAPVARQQPHAWCEQ